jgi:hypothetical protein
LSFWLNGPVSSRNGLRKTARAAVRDGGDRAPNVRQRHHDGIKHRVCGLDACNRALRHLGGRDLPGGNQITQHNRIEPAQIVRGDGETYAI